MRTFKESEEKQSGLRHIEMDGNVIQEDELENVIVGSLIHAGCMKAQAKELAPDIVNAIFRNWGDDSGNDD